MGVRNFVCLDQSVPGINPTRSGTYIKILKYCYTERRSENTRIMIKSRARRVSTTVKYMTMFTMPVPVTLDMYSSTWQEISIPGKMTTQPKSRRQCLLTVLAPSNTRHATGKNLTELQRSSFPLGQIGEAERILMGPSSVSEATLRSRSPN